MNPQGRVGEQFSTRPSSSSSCSRMASGAAPQPMEGLHDAGPPPFLTKTYDIVEDSNTNHIVSWSSGNNSFVVWDPQTFSITLLPRYFKHNNFSSFVRQLNTYGFRKVDPDKWEFANEGFLRGQRHLLKNIRRRRTLQTQASQQALEACVELGRFGLDGEVDRLRRDKQVLMVELVKLRQQQQNTREYLQVMEQRIRKTEMKQQHMVNFLARAMQNPNFVQQLVQQKDRRKEFEELITRKKRRHIDQGPSNVEVGELGQGGEGGVPFVKIEPDEYGDISDFEVVSELGILSMDMHGLSESQNVTPDEKYKGEETLGSKDNYTVADEFWEDFLNEDIDGEILGGEGEQEQDVDILAEQLGLFDSSPK